MGSKIRMHDTGLYLSFETSSSIAALTYRTPDDDKAWETFWTAWVESGRFLPPKSITLTERWFHRRTAGSPDLHAYLRDQIAFRVHPTVFIIMNFTFMVYGGLHLLAWQYNSRSRSERYLWRISAVTTASTSLVLLTLSVAIRLGKYRFSPRRGSKHASHDYPRARSRFYRWTDAGLHWLSYFLVVVDISSRAFLVIESFIALPNSPRSTYTIPSWTAYIPHI